MDASPHTPPSHTTGSFTTSATPAIDTLCFVVNFAFSTLFFITCVLSIGAADNPVALIAGILFVLPVACYAVAEWICWYRKRHWLYRPLGMFNLLFAAFFAFGLVTNVGESFMADEPVDLLFVAIFVIGFAIVAGYLGWCGWRRAHAVSIAADVISNCG